MSVLEAKNITKIFPGVKALEDVSVSFHKGEIHCIMGENGAGKSTLIKCLTGVYEAENGEIFINDKSALKDRSLFKRIAYVPQEISLFQKMTVAENLFIPYDKAGIKGRINQKKLEEQARPILDKFNIHVEPGKLADEISVSSQQLLQIARAAAFSDYDVLILDEPTTCLTQKDTENLFDIIRKIKKEGKAIIFISHKLDEVFELGDCITVFCNGRKVSTADLKEVDVPWVVEQMTGKQLDYQEIFCSENVGEELVLDVKQLTGTMFHDVSFSLKKGEILGFSGLVGAGRSELMQAIFGYLPIFSGEIVCQGKAWKMGDTHYSVKHGMFYLPEERRSQGILPDMSVKENISINTLDTVSSWCGISKRKEITKAEEIIKAYNVKTSDLNKEIKFLSGGNQQKVIIGRSTCTEPKILIFDEPTKGIDIGAKTEVYRLMKELAEKGIAIILISSEMDEIKKCANRIICMYHGEVTGECNYGSEKEEILKAILGIKTSDEEGQTDEQRA